MNPAVEQLRAAVERLVHEGRAEGIEPDGPLGVWLEAPSEALEGLAAVLDGQEERFEALLTNIRAANQTELAKLTRRWMWLGRLFIKEIRRSARRAMRRSLRVSSRRRRRSG